MMKHTKWWLLAGLMFSGATYAQAQGKAANGDFAQEYVASVAQIVALDECEPKSFNKALGHEFCKNVALATLGFATDFDELFLEASKGQPDPKWDFEPDTLKVMEGTIVSVVDQGGEPHTFTEVAHFGGGFVAGLNAPGEETVPECSGGFGNLAVAKTRILQGSTSLVTRLPKGEHYFQCCIHPWMRVKIDVK